MKTIKIGEEKQKKTITREIISKIGETVYHSQDVERVTMDIDFKDGSSIRFRRSERDDEFSELRRKRFEDDE